MAADVARDLPDGLVREAHAPDRLVLLWSARPAEDVVAAVLEAGELPVSVPPEETLALVEQAGAPALMLVDPDLLDDAALQVLTAVQGRHPQTRVALLADESSSGAGLLGAMRAGLSEVVHPSERQAVAALVRGTAGGRGSTERVLAVGAHPDDVEIGCGATLLRHRAAGHPVTVLTLSRGAVGGLQEERRREAIGAAIMMGAELIMGDLPDTRMSEANEAISLVEHVISVVRPTTLYVHSKWDNHQDHRNVHDVTMIARSARGRARWAGEGQQPRSEGAPGGRAGRDRHDIRPGAVGVVPAEDPDHVLAGDACTTPLGIRARHPRPTSEARQPAPGRARTARPPAIMCRSSVDPEVER